MELMIVASQYKDRRMGLTVCSSYISVRMTGVVHVISQLLYQIGRIARNLMTFLTISFDQSHHFSRNKQVQAH